MVAPRPDVAEPIPAPRQADENGQTDRGQAARARRRRRRADLRTVAAVLAVALALSPIAWDILRTASHLDRTYFPWGDDALLELNARDALGGRQLVGPYSRFGWHHPGPAQAFVLSLPVRLAGDGAGLPLGAALWNLGVAGAVLALVWRRHGPTAAIVASLAIGVVLAGAPPDVFRQPWNPYMVLLPMLLLLVLVGDVVGSSGVLSRLVRDAVPGRAWAGPGVVSLAWGTAVGTFCVQTHVSTGPTVVALLTLGALSLVVAGIRARRAGPPSPGWWRRPSALAGLGLALLLWLPPAWEALTRNPGNPGLMVRFFAEGSPGASPREAVKSSILAMSAFPFGFPPNTLTPDRTRASLLGGLALLVVLTVVAVGVARWRRSGAAAGVLLAAGLAGVVAATANTRINGGIHDYLVVWQESVPGALIVAVGVALGRPRWSTTAYPHASGGGTPRSAGRRAPYSVALVGLLLASAVAVQNVRFLQGRPAAPFESNPGVEAAVAAIRPVLRPGDSRVLLLIQDCDAWPAAAGVAVALEREGRAIAVDGARCSWGEFNVYFGEHRRRRGDESIALEWALAGPPGRPLTTTPLPGTFINAVAGWRHLR